VFFGKGNVGYNNGTNFILINSTNSEFEGPMNFTFFDNLSVELYSDATAPEILVNGSFDLFSSGPCVSENFSVNHLDVNLWDRETIVNGTIGNFAELEFCSVGNHSFTTWAEDEVGHRSQINRTIYVGNLTHTLNYSLPLQTWWINQSGNYSILWNGFLKLNVDGYASGNVSWDVRIFDKNITYNRMVSGPWSENVIESSSNETVEIMGVEVNFTFENATYGCMEYNLSKEIEFSGFFKPPPYNPKTHHAFVWADSVFSTNGVLNQGEWWVRYEGNQTSFKICVAEGHEPNLLWCGDGKCNNGETCSTCSVDCGSCTTSSGGGGGTVHTVGSFTNPIESNDITNVIIDENVTEQNNTQVAETNFITGHEILINETMDLVLVQQTRVTIADGLMLSDGENYYVGTLVLEEGNYSVLNLSDSVESVVIEENSKLGISWVVLFALVIGLLAGLSKAF
ncbi:MAG: hypothetical protein GOV01_03325, partial [Candidatus Altiarchaeota archaeon]|nr:hypothetical protein [Candidatus Altiarchaeota archaeon]